jgi:hypothetical protein
MVIETRGGAQIGVLNEKVQGIQQQVEEHSNQFGLINVKVDRMDTNFGEFKATLCGFQSTLCGFQSTLSSFQAMMEERLPKPAEMNHQPASWSECQPCSKCNLGCNLVWVSNCQRAPPEQSIGFQLGAKDEECLMPMRAPNQTEEQPMVQPEPQR